MNDSGLQQQAVVGAAMIAMRDLTGDQRTRYLSWAMGAFSAAVQGEDDPVTRAREGLKFNPAAIAFAGIAYAMADGAAREQAAALLAFVHRPAAAHGFIAAASAVAAANDRLPQAIVRCALRASIYATRHRDGRDEDRAARVQQHRRAVDAAIEAELAWLYDGGAEPPWPALPDVRPRTRRGIRLPGGQDERRLADATDRDAQIDRFDYQAAAAILADVMAVSGDDGLVPEGTEPSGAAVSEHLDAVPGVPERMPQERRPARGGKKQRAPGRVSVVARA